MSAAGTVRTPALEIAYLERGPRDGVPVLLVHGFPDDARTWDRLAEALSVAGYRTIAPFLRGFGPTRFLTDAPRTGEITALACDVIAFADALGIARFHLIGHDWGARTAYGVAALWPERLRALCGFAVPHGATTPAQTLSVEQTRAYWYQWYFATPRGEDELTTNRRAFCRALWRCWAPNWRFDDEEYERTAASFENPDFVTIALTSYRQRWGFIVGADAYAAERERLAAIPPLTVPTLTLLGADDGATLPSSAAGKERLFRGPYRSEIVSGSGHFLQREQPAVVAERVVAHLRAYETG